MDSTFIHTIGIESAGMLEHNEKFALATEILRCRILGEPFNFHLIAARVDGRMFHESEKDIRAAIGMYLQKGSYSIGELATKTGSTIYDLQCQATRHADTTIEEALNNYLSVYSQVVEREISVMVPAWIADGMDGTQIQIESGKIREKRCVSAKVIGSDGVDDFEKQLIASLEGKLFDYPVKPFLQSERDQTPFYEPGDYVIVGALSGGGKSYYALNTLLYNSKAGIPGTYINLEMTPANVHKRMWQMEMGIRFERNMSHLPDADLRRAQYTWEALTKMPYKSINPGNDITPVINTVRQEYYERGIQFAIIDYVQLMKSAAVRGSRANELEDVSQRLRALALNLKIVIIAIAQIKQEVAKTRDKRGGLYDIKDCANFTQDATLVKMLYRPEYFGITEDETGSLYPAQYADIAHVKGRESGTALCLAKFNHIQGFYSADEEVRAIFPAPNSVNQPIPEYKPSIPAMRRNDEDIPF